MTIDRYSNSVCFILPSMSLVIMRDPVSLLFCRVLAVIYNIWTRTIFGPFPLYILKYNALRFGAESFSFFRLIPEHVMTVVLKIVGLKAGNLCCPRNVVCCILTHWWKEVKIFCDFKFLYLCVTPYSSVSFSSAPHPHLPSVYDSSAGLWRWRVTMWYKPITHAHVVSIKPRQWKSEINTSHAHSILPPAKYLVLLFWPIMYAWHEDKFY
jgi:hypothetical protein